MDRKKVDLIWLYVSILSYLLMSVMFLLMPLDNMIPSLKYGKFIAVVGVGFWSFMVIGIIAQIVLARRRKSWYRIRHLNDKRSSVRRVGLISFGANRIAMAADIGMIISLCGLIISLILTEAAGYICYVFLTAFSFTFCMHCILNGKVYYHITHHYESNGRYVRTTPSEHKKTEGEK